MCMCIISVVLWKLILFFARVFSFLFLLFLFFSRFLVPSVHIKMIKFSGTIKLNYSSISFQLHLKFSFENVIKPLKTIHTERIGITMRGNIIGTQYVSSFKKTYQRIFAWDTIKYFFFSLRLLLVYYVHFKYEEKKKKHHCQKFVIITALYHSQNYCSVHLAKNNGRFKAIPW